MPTRWRFEATNAAAGLREASDELESILASQGVSVAAQMAARLVCEEIVLNAFEHGGATWVTLEVDSARQPHVLVFEDDGARFSPATRTDRAGAGTQGDVSPRGRGLILVGGFTRSIDHHFADGRNRLNVLLVE